MGLLVSQARVEKNAIRLATAVTNSEFDVSSFSKACFFVWTIPSGILAFLSAKMYLKIGGDGTPLLFPTQFFKDKKTFGEICSFGCNGILNWFFMTHTLLDLRERFYIPYLAHKKLNIPYGRLEVAGIVTKLVIAFVMAVVTGIMIATVAAYDAKQPAYITAITGMIYSFLHLVGSLEIIELVLAGVEKTRSRFFGKKKNKIIDPNLIKQKITLLKALPNSDPIWNNLALRKNLIIHLLFGVEINSFIAIKEIENKTSFFSIVSFLLLQAVNAFSVLSWWFSVVTNTGIMFGTPPVASWIVGTLFISPYIVLAFKMLHDTMLQVQDTYRHYKAIVSSEQDAGKILKIEIASSVMIFMSYMMSYVASNAFLDLNESNGQVNLNYAPINFLSSIGATAFGGYAFLIAFGTLASFVKERMVYSGLKRQVIKLADNLYSFAHLGVLDLGSKKEDSDVESQNNLFVSTLRRAVS